MQALSDFNHTDIEDNKRSFSINILVQIVPTRTEEMLRLHLVSKKKIPRKLNSKAVCYSFKKLCSKIKYSFLKPNATKNFQKQ